jgi:hypothetical protein
MTTSNENKLIVQSDNLSFNEQSQQTLIDKGDKSLKTNRFFQFMDIIMNDDKLRGFIDEFFGDWDDVKTSILMMKTYQVIDLELKHLEETKRIKIGQTNRRKLMIGLIKEMMTNSECRQELVKNMNVFMGTEHLNCRKMIAESVISDKNKLE